MTADVVDSAKERKELLLLLQYAEQKEREREKKRGRWINYSCQDNNNMAIGERVKEKQPTITTTKTLPLLNLGSLLKKDKELLYAACSCNHHNSVVFFCLISILIASLLNQWLLHIAFSKRLHYTLATFTITTNIGTLSDFHCGTYTIKACC